MANGTNELKIYGNLTENDKRLIREKKIVFEW